MSLQNQLNQKLSLHTRVVLLSVLAPFGSRRHLARRAFAKQGFNPGGISSSQRKCRAGSGGIRKTRMLQAKQKATEAKAAELSPEAYRQALQLEGEATALKEQRRNGDAINRFSAAVAAYARSESEAAKEAERQLQLATQQKQQAQNARQAFLAARKSADGFGAARLDSYRKAVEQASQAQPLWDRSDFISARARFELALQTMETAQSQAEADQLKQDQQAIQVLVAGFEVALNRKDMTAVKSYWPSLPLPRNKG